MTTTSRARALLAFFLLLDAAPLAADMIGQDAPACAAGHGPAIQANIVGLKDRVGEVWLELYPATEADFLRPDEELIAEGKTFRRTRSHLPASGAVSICVRVPRPGRYALLLRHNRVGKDKFSIFSDGAGFPSNQRLGRSRPKHSQALIDAGPGITVANIRVQYLRGLGGFGPL
ncbi:DUF2141 domain-containing protein [Sphingomonas oligophenolica]|uniref:DUF2141 domain-containing protein n=1 Tax=Sphingomonas oligophenolica TaxID=301154 RepID=A0ABU9Y844_9SPHN